MFMVQHSDLIYALQNGYHSKEHFFSMEERKEKKDGIS